MLYRETFNEVHAPQRLKEEVMNMTKQERTQVVKKISVSFIIAAALAVILAGTALAAVMGVPETLQEWFNQQWTEAGGPKEMPKEQAAVIESLVQPVDVTCVNKGISVTLDSVTPGEGGLWLMYKVKGEALEDQRVDRWFFEGKDLGGRLMENEIVDDSLGFTVRTATERRVGVTEDGTHIFLLFYAAPKGVNFLEGGDTELRLDGLAMWGQRDEKTGEVPDVDSLQAKWILPFTLAPTENVEGLTVKSAKVPCVWYETEERPRPAPMEIKDIRITTMGVSFLEPAWENAEEREYVTMDVAVRLKDGIEIAFNGEGSMGAMNVGDRCFRSWELPVDLSKVEAIRFGDVVIPVKQAEK